MVLAACGGKSERANDDGERRVDVRGAPASEVDALLPEPLKGKVGFEKVEMESGWVIRPRGWETGAIPGRLKPPAGAEGLGFQTVFATGRNCDGECVKKDWSSVSEKVEFAQFRGGGWQLEKEVDLGQGRLVVARQGERVDIAVARWTTDATGYDYCRVTLDAPLREAVGAFEAACLGGKGI